MSGLTIGWVFALGLPTLLLHMGSVCLSRALRTYSRSRLEDVCKAHGRPERADEIAHHDEKAERGVEALAVLTGLALAALLGAAMARAAPGLTGEAVVAIALTIGALGHVAAGVSGRVYAESILDAAWPVADFLRRLMIPFTFVSRQVEALVYRRTRRSANGGGPRPPSVEVELHHSLPDDHEENLEADLPESTREMLERAIELAHRDVSEIMTPRSNILALPATVSPMEAARAFIDSGRSRIPLYGEHRDDIVGILYAKMIEGKPLATLTPRKLARPALFIPETKNAAELLQEFRTRRIQMAIVFDEYGGVSGLITLEDLLEEIVGPIDDEHDVPTPEDPLIPISETRYELDASLPLEDLNERLDLNLPTDGDFQTVGGLAFDVLGRVPEPGETFRAGGVEFTVLEVVDHSIRRLRLDIRPSTAPVGP